MKPGYKTTEFWLTLGASLAAAALVHFQNADGTVAIVTTAVLTAVYALLRASLKAKQ